MTIRFEPPGWPDRLLALVGRRRAVRLPPPAPPGFTGQVLAPREPLLRALLRPATAPLPDGWIYPEDLET